MIFPPDKYLQDKFDRERKSPPPEVWNRIQAGLDQRKSKKIWFRYSAASAIIVLLAASITLWQFDQPTNHTISSGKNITEENIPEHNYTNKATEEKQITTNHISPNVKSSKPVRSNQTNIKTQNNIQPDIEINEKITTSQTEEEIPLVATISNPDSSTMEATPVEEKVVVTPPTGKKIYYSAAEVNARFLKKKDTATAPSTEKTESGIQKILDIAYDIKYSESALGDLRQYKDDILSFPAKKTQGKNN